ncbi:hypothetical protein O181_072924 [Austropuccinia psidii MF-1]|uniref:Uncharacterized protein n=1 Tax=Austropuccinia psidii MF-1 TaxID=1389203 RepID=A0A9Q3F646_9BASI|nr:hypothetical protein [Austropuccinia psidii MF-1]
MDNKRFNLTSHWAELGASFQKICLKEIDFRYLMVITKVWNPTRQFRLLQVRENRIRENQATIKISGQESPSFTIPGDSLEKTRIQGQKQNHLKPEEERVTPNDPEAIGFGERSSQEPEEVVNNSRISSNIHRNITPTQIEHNVVTPETNLNSGALWLQMSKIAEQTQKQFVELQASHERMKTLTVSMHKTVKTLQEGHAQAVVSKRNNISWVEFKDKPRERVAEVAKKKSSFHNCGLRDHYAKNCPKANKKVSAIENIPEEESPAQESDSSSMGDAIKEQSDKEQDPREEFVVEYQEETPLEIHDIQLEAGMPQDTPNKNLCKHTQDAQTYQVTPTKGIAYIYGTATKMIFCIDNAQNPLIIDSQAQCSIVARNNLDNHFPN